MKEFTAFWKVFRILCILQLILVAFLGVKSFGQLFSQSSTLLNLVNVVAYTIVFMFVYHGLSILNYNYPDQPLSDKQKRMFNILYLSNFILIAFLFARIVNDWWMVRFIFDKNIVRSNGWYVMTAFWLISWLIFIIHFITLGGMFKLRHFIHQNTLNTWYDQFDQKQ